MTELLHAFSCVLVVRGRLLGWFVSNGGLSELVRGCFEAPACSLGAALGAEDILQDHTTHSVNVFVRILCKCFVELTPDVIPAKADRLVGVGGLKRGQRAPRQQGGQPSSSFALHDYPHTTQTIPNQYALVATARCCRAGWGG